MTLLHQVSTWPAIIGTKMPLSGKALSSSARRSCHSGSITTSRPSNSFNVLTVRCKGLESPDQWSRIPILTLSGLSRSQQSRRGHLNRGKLTKQPSCTPGFLSGCKYGSRNMHLLLHRARYLTAAPWATTLGKSSRQDFPSLLPAGTPETLKPQGRFRVTHHDELVPQPLPRAYTQ